MWTHCSVGGTTGAATCAPVGANSVAAATVSGNVSKRYGNSMTAAQIAVSRGGSGAMLTGPGNSQPHKVSACGKPGNPSGGVDVHAVKGYSAAACTTTHAQVAAAANTQASVTAHTTAPTVAATTQVTASASTQVAASTAPSQHAAGVLGTHAKLGKSKAAPTHGVLGEVTNVAGSTLPFTGFPLWVAAVAGLALIAAGLLLRRRGSRTVV